MPVVDMENPSSSCRIVIISRHQDDVHDKSEIVKVTVSNKEANLSNLRLEKIPKEVLQVCCLKVLKLNNNLIDSVPPTLISETPTLEVFEINGNWIERFPKNIGDWTKLRRLSATENGLKNLPLSFYKMDNLQYLNLKDNPLDPEFARLYEDEWNHDNCREAARRTVHVMRQVKRLLIANYPDEASQILRKYHVPKAIVEPIYGSSDALSSSSPKANETLKPRSESEAIDDDDLFKNDPFADLEQELLRDDLQKLERNKTRSTVDNDLTSLKNWCKYALSNIAAYTLLDLCLGLYLTILLAHFVDNETLVNLVVADYREWMIIKHFLLFHKVLQDQMVQYKYPIYIPVVKSESENLSENLSGWSSWSWLWL